VGREVLEGKGEGERGGKRRDEKKGTFKGFAFSKSNNGDRRL